MRGRGDRGRAQAADLREAAKAGKLTRTTRSRVSAPTRRRTSAAKARDTVLALAEDRYDEETIAYLASVHEDGIRPRDLLVLASMEWIDITRDMDSGAIRRGEGYRLRTQVLDTLRKLSENETDPAAVPNMIQINVNTGGADRLGDGGKNLELAG